MKKLVMLSFLPALLALTAGCALADNTWIVDATLCSGYQCPGGPVAVINTITGTFNVTPGLTISSWNITVNGDTSQFIQTYNVGNSNVSFFTPTDIVFYTAGFADYVTLYLSSPLTTTPNHIPLLAGAGFPATGTCVTVDGSSPCTYMSTDPNVPNFVKYPEPASTELLGAEGVALGLGFGLFALLRPKRFLNS